MWQGADLTTPGDTTLHSAPQEAVLEPAEMRELRPSPAFTLLQKDLKRIKALQAIWGCSSLGVTTKWLMETGCDVTMRVDAVMASSGL